MGSLHDVRRWLRCARGSLPGGEGRRAALGRACPDSWVGAGVIIGSGCAVEVPKVPLHLAHRQTAGPERDHLHVEARRRALMLRHQLRLERLGLLWQGEQSLRASGRSQPASNSSRSSGLSAIAILLESQEGSTQEFLIGPALPGHRQTAESVWLRHPRQFPTPDPGSAASGLIRMRAQGTPSRRINKTRAP